MPTVIAAPNFSRSKPPAAPRPAGRHCTAIGPQLAEHTGMLLEQIDERQHQHHEPQRLGPHLQPADGGDAVGDERDHHQRADQVAPGRRDVERELERVGHDRRLEREEDEGERGVDQRGDGRADVAEAGAAREQVHVHAVARRIDADRPAGQEDDQAGGEDGPERVDEAVVDQQRAADGLEHEERRGAEGGVGHPHRRPLAKRPRREAQRVVFHRLAGDPAVVVAAHLHDALHRIGALARRVTHHGRAEAR